MLRTAALLVCAGTVAAHPTNPLGDTGVKPGTEGSVTHGKVTIMKEDVPEDAEPYWPWKSGEDFFRWSGLSYDYDLEPADVQKCSSDNPHSKVYTVSDGKEERCFVAITPPTVHTAAPVLFFAHGSGGSAFRCGDGPDNLGETWDKFAQANGFIFVCGEAVISTATNNITGSKIQGGIWSLPEVFNDTSDRSCEPSENIEAAYMAAVIEKMQSMPETFDLSRTFYHGCSEGSAFTQWQGVCAWQNAPKNVTAFATHSTGLKVKGDGNILPPCHTDPSVTWGECDKCKYWPTVPGKFDGLKACIFDNTEDPNSRDPLFYKTSVQMGQYYKKEGSRYEESYGSGGHCVQHSFAAIAKCMDDGTGRLIQAAGPCTDEAPSANYTCAQQAALGKCNRTWMDGYCCKTCFNCTDGCSNNASRLLL